MAGRPAGVQIFVLFQPGSRCLEELHSGSGVLANDKEHPVSADRHLSGLHLGQVLSQIPGEEEDMMKDENMAVGPT